MSDFKLGDVFSEIGDVASKIGGIVRDWQIGDLQMDILQNRVDAGWTGLSGFDGGLPSGPVAPAYTAAPISSGGASSNNNALLLIAALGLVVAAGAWLFPRR